MGTHGCAVVERSAKGPRGAVDFRDGSRPSASHRGSVMTVHRIRSARARARARARGEFHRDRPRRTGRAPVARERRRGAAARIDPHVQTSARPMLRSKNSKPSMLGGRAAKGGVPRPELDRAGGGRERSPRPPRVTASCAGGFAPWRVWRRARVGDLPHHRGAVGGPEASSRPSARNASAETGPTCPSAPVFALRPGRT